MAVQETQGGLGRPLPLIDLAPSESDPASQQVQCGSYATTVLCACVCCTCMLPSANTIYSIPSIQ